MHCKEKWIYGGTLEKNGSVIVRYKEKWNCDGTLEKMEALLCTTRRNEIIVANEIIVGHTEVNGK